MTEQTPIKVECPVETAFKSAMTGGSDLVTKAIEAVRQTFPAVVSPTDYNAAEAKASALRKAARNLAKN